MNNYQGLPRPESIALWVCTDCYTAYHYGAVEITDADADEHNPPGWYAGLSDIPADREPLTELDWSRLADDTNSNSADSGIDTFSSSTCNGCGSRLGGSRYRLAYFDNPIGGA